MQEQERWLSVEEIAAHLGVNCDTVYNWIDRKRMPAHKVRRLWKFRVSQVDEWVQAGQASVAAENEEERSQAGSDGPRLRGVIANV